MQQRFHLPIRVTARATLLAVFSLLFLVTSKASQITNRESDNPETLTAPLRSQVVRYQGRTETVRVPAVMEPWSATAVPTVPPQRKITSFVGHFPGFEAAKREVNLRTRAATLTRAFTRNVTPLDSGGPSDPSVIFEGPNESDTPFVPPNPNRAAGPNYIVVLINSLMAIYDKSGNLHAGYNDLPTFFASLGATGDVYDPRVIYDQNDNRFIMSFTNVDLLNPTFGNILMAVSQTSDPTGNWYKFELGSKGFNVADNAATFPDFPTLGLSTSAVYISNGQFELNSSCMRTGGCSFSDTWIRVIGLPGLLSGNPNLTITTFTDVRTTTGFPAFAIEAALTYGASSQEFLVAAEFSANPGKTFNVFAINTAETPTLSTANLTVPYFAIPGEAYQPVSTIETGDFRPLNAIASSGTLWCAQNSANDQDYGAVGRWYAISIPTLAGIALSQTGSFSGAGSAYFPAVAAKPNGDVIVSFTTSSVTQFASAAFTGRAASDASGTMRGYAVYRAGTDNYSDFTFRWGDYNGASVDPDGNSVWTIVEYAGSPNPHFGTAIAQVSNPPLFTSSTLSLDFGTEPVTLTGGAQSVTFTNVSGASVVMGTASLGGVNASDFAVSADTCSGSTIAAGGNCTLSVTFTPSATGSRNALLTINSNPPTFPLMILLAGDGTPLTGVLIVSPSALNFPDTPAMTASAPQTVTVSNHGAVPFSVSVSTVTSAFAVASNCLSPIAAGGSCTLQVTFRPQTVGSLSGTINVGTTVGNQSGSINLSGNGIAAPAATLCPTSVSFGNQTVGSTTSPQGVTVNSTGTGSLTLSQITISGDFAQTNTCGSPGSKLPALTACTVSVTFTPKSTGVRNGTLTVTDNAAGSPHLVSLTGTGVVTSGALLPSTSPLATSLAGLGGSVLAASADGPDIQARERGKKSYAQLPLSFEANRGQFDARVRFLSRGPGYSLFLTAQEAVLALSPTTGEPGATADHGLRKAESGPSNPNPDPRAPATLRIELMGTRPAALISGLDELPGKTHYFRGKDPREWHTNIPNYARVRYRAIYPGIDLVYYGHERQLEYDFVVTPGADPAAIALEIRAGNPTPLRMAENGDLIVHVPGGDVDLHKPRVYQTDPPPPSSDASSAPANRPTSPVEGRYILTASHQVRFALGPYDHSKSLVIDPVLSYSTYLGGNAQDVAYGIAVDAAGEAYVVGTTSSEDFPVANALQPAINRTLPYTSDVFITKLSADGSSFVFSTFLGGSNSDSGAGIALDSAGNAYVTGQTASADFPVTSGAFQSQGGSLFVAKLSSDGSTLIYSTLLGGTGWDQAHGIGVDASGNAYLTGTTTSLDFPITPGAFQSRLTAGNWNCGWLTSCGFGFVTGFVTALNAQGSELLYSTYLGGTGFDSPQAIAVDAAGDAYVTGIAGSIDFPTTPGALQTGAGSLTESFVTKLSPSGQPVYSTYLADISSSAIAIDGQGAAYLAGQGTPGSNPTMKSSQFGQTPSNNPDVSVAKLHPAGCALVYSTFLGGFWGGFGTAVTVDSSGAAFVAGGTVSEDFPTVNPVQAGCWAFNPSFTFACPFVSKLDPTGSSLNYSTLLGGSTSENGVCCNKANAIGIDGAGNAYIAGQTHSSDFPTANAIQSQYGGQEDGFVAKISPAIVPSLSISPTYLSFSNQGVGTISPPQTVTVTNQTASTVNISSIGINGLNPQFTETNTCGTSLAASASCTITVRFNPTEDGTLVAFITINDNAFAGPHVLPVYGAGVTPPTASFSGEDLSGNLLTFGAVPVGTSVGPLIVLVQNSGSLPLTITNVAISGDFSDTTDCVQTLQQGGLCSIRVGFKPTASGSRTGILTVFDNAAGGQQQIQITGTGYVPDFSLSATSTIASVSPGESTSYSVSLSPMGGYSRAVTLSCSGAPQGATCSISPSHVVLDGTDVATVTLTVTTTAPSFSFPARRFSPPRWILHLPRPITLFALLLALAAIIVCRRRLLGALVAVVMLAALWGSCGGGAGGGGGGGGGNPGTPAGTYTLTVTGTSGSLAHTLNLTLTVN